MHVWLVHACVLFPSKERSSTQMEDLERSKTSNFYFKNKKIKHTLTHKMRKLKNYGNE